MHIVIQENDPNTFTPISNIVRLVRTDPQFLILPAIGVWDSETRYRCDWTFMKKSQQTSGFRKEFPGKGWKDRRIWIRRDAFKATVPKASELVACMSWQPII